MDPRMFFGEMIVNQAKKLLASCDMLRSSRGHALILGTFYCVLRLMVACRTEVQWPIRLEHTAVDAHRFTQKPDSTEWMREREKAGISQGFDG